MTSDWISAELFATIAGVTPRAARKTLGRALIGKLYRGTALVVRQTTGRGGKAGLQYQVRVDSLPLDLQSRINAPSKALSQPLKLPVEAAKMSAVMTVFGEMFAKIDATRPNTQARTAVYQAWSERHLVDLKGSGQIRRYSIRALQRFYREHNHSGVGALARKGRADKGRRRVLISREWDQLSLTPEKQGEIRETLQRYIRSLWANGYQFGQILFRANIRLHKLTVEAGVTAPANACRVPKALIDAEREFYSAIHVYKTDRKAHNNRLPRQPRDYSAITYNDLWFVDCTKSDIMLGDSEELRAHAGLIAWMDAATQMVHMDTVILPKGSSITNSHVIGSFKRALQKFGVPREICVDNGSEFNNFDFVPGLLRLARGGPNEGYPVHRSIPYEPNGKAMLEGWFSIFQGRYLVPAPGYIGGDRLSSKVANSGHRPVPWKLGKDAFFRYLENQIEIYHHTQKTSGPLKGKSPYEALDEQIRAGATRIDFNEEAFLIAFSELVPRVVSQRTIKFNGKIWTCPELDSYPGERVLIRAPKYDDWQRLPVYDRNETLIGWAGPLSSYGPLDIRGAKDGHTRRARARAGIHKLEQDIDPIDHVAEVAELASTLKPMPAAPSIGAIGATPEAKALARGVKRSAKSEREEREEEHRQELDIQRQLYEEFMASGATREAGNQ